MEKLIVNNRMMTSPKSIWRIVAKYILIICGVIVLLGAGFRFLMGDEVSIFSEVIFPVLIFIQGFRMSGRTGGYILVPLEIILGKNEVRFVYPDIDRQDGKGNHKEIYIYRSEDVAELQSNSEANAVRIVGRAEFTGEYPDGTREYINGQEQEMNYTLQIALTNEQDLGQVIDGLQKSLSRIVYQVS